MSIFAFDVSGYGYNHGGYGGYGQECEEIKQDSCYNKPQVATAEKELILILPEPRRECKQKTFTLPRVNCQMENEKKCISVPTLVSRPVTTQKCVPEIGNPKCDQIELVLPKQVCKDILIGSAHTVPKYPSRYSS